MKTVSSLFAAFLLATSLTAQAAVTITIQEVGNDVVVTGTGYVSIDPSFNFGTEPYSSSDILNPSNYTIQAGSNTETLNYYLFQPHWENPSSSIDPPYYGTGSVTQQPTNNTGDAFGISFPNYATLQISLPDSYEEGDTTNFSMTFAEATLETLGIDLGSSQWSWGADEEGQFVYLNVIPRAIPPDPVAPTPVPALGIFGLLGLAGAIGAAGSAMNRRRKQ